MNRRGLELIAAFGLLSRLPVWRLAPNETHVDFAASVWAYPVAGAIIGALGGGAYWAASLIGFAPHIAAIWALATLLLITGALHEDGLADTADGLGGGRTASRKLEIMRDSRIGSYGALALMLAIAARTLTIGAIAAPSHVMAALITAGAFSRAAMIVVLISAAPARKDGMASGLISIPFSAALAGLALPVLIATLLLPTGRALALSAITAVIALAFARLATRQIGGHTGDVLGATALVTECVLLSLLTL